MRNRKEAYRPGLKPAKPIIDYFAGKRKRNREISLKKFVMSSCYVSNIMLTKRTGSRVAQDIVAMGPVTSKS